MRELLGANWKIVVDRRGIITCYNKARFTEISTSYDDIERTRTFELLDTLTKNPVEVTNIWGEYSPFPRRIETLIRNILSPKPTDKPGLVRILGGDSNGRISLSITSQEILQPVSFPLD